VRNDTDVVDIVAEKDGRRLYAEVKAASAAPDLDVDTAIGQLVRRMPRCGHRNGFSTCWRWRCMRSMTTAACGSSSAGYENRPGMSGTSAVRECHRNAPREWVVR